MRERADEAQEINGQDNDGLGAPLPKEKQTSKASLLAWEINAFVKEKRDQNDSIFKVIDAKYYKQLGEGLRKVLYGQQCNFLLG